MHVFLYHQNEHGQYFLVLVFFFFPFIEAGMASLSIHSNMTPFYHYPERCTGEDETLHIFGEFGEAK